MEVRKKGGSLDEFIQKNKKKPKNEPKKESGKTKKEEKDLIEQPIPKPKTEDNKIENIIKEIKEPKIEPIELVEIGNPTYSMEKSISNNLLVLELKQIKKSIQDLFRMISERRKDHRILAEIDDCITQLINLKSNFKIEKVKDNLIGIDKKKRFDQEPESCDTT